MTPRAGVIVNQVLQGRSVTGVCPTSTNSVSPAAGKLQSVYYCQPFRHPDFVANAYFDLYLIRFMGDAFHRQTNQINTGYCQPFMYLDFVANAYIYII